MSKNLGGNDAELREEEIEDYHVMTALLAGAGGEEVKAGLLRVWDKRTGQKRAVIVAASTDAATGMAELRPLALMLTTDDAVNYVPSLEEGEYETFDYRTSEGGPEAFPFPFITHEDVTAHLLEAKKMFDIRQDDQTKVEILAGLVLMAINFPGDETPAHEVYRKRVVDISREILEGHGWIDSQ